MESRQGLGNMAAIYDDHFSWFTQMTCDPLARFMDPHRSDLLPADLLDLCCGTGGLALFMAARGYRVTGLDIAEEMLDVARRKAAEESLEDQVTFVHGDATLFAFPEKFSFVTSTFDSLNNLPTADALASCFSSARAAVRDGGFFIFDMLTMRGVGQDFVNIDVSKDNIFLTERRFCEPSAKRQQGSFTVFVRAEDGRWDRYDQSVSKTIFEPDHVLDLLRAAGWSRAWPALLTDLSQENTNTARDPRVVYVAQAG